MHTTIAKQDAKKKFEEYRHYLKNEATRLASYIACFRMLYERRVDRLEEMNIAPAFFQVVADALLSAIILWVNKLFDKRGERSIFNFLKFVEFNRSILRDPINRETINQDRERIESLDYLQNFKILRDKFYAHFDKEYFFNRERMANEAPTWGDLEKVIEVTSDVINDYSVAYDGRYFELRPMNINDLDYLLDRLHKCKKLKSS